PRPADIDRQKTGLSPPALQTLSCSVPNNRDRTSHPFETKPASSRNTCRYSLTRVTMTETANELETPDCNRRSDSRDRAGGGDGSACALGGGTTQTTPGTSL